MVIEKLYCSSSGLVGEFLYARTNANIINTSMEK